MKYKIKRNYILKCVFIGVLIFSIITFTGYSFILFNYLFDINSSETSNGIYYDGYIIFEVNNQMVEVKETSNLYEDGDKFTVYYDVNDYNKCFTSVNVSTDLKNVTFIIPLIIWVVLLIILNKKNKEEKYLMKHGKKVKARLIEIKRFKEDNTKYCILKCEYDTIIGDKYYFSSQKIYSMKIYNSKYTRGTVIVYYNEKNTGEYVVTECEFR